MTRIMEGIINNQLALWVKILIERCRQRIAVSFNSKINFLHWTIGKKINEDILKNDIAKHGKQVIAVLSALLTTEYDKVRSTKRFQHYLCAMVTFTDKQIFSALDSLKRGLYIQMYKIECLSSITLNDHIKFPTKQFWAIQWIYSDISK